MKVRFTLARIEDSPRACQKCKFFKTCNIYTHREKGKQAGYIPNQAFWPLCDKCIQEINEDWIKKELYTKGIDQK